MELPYPEHAEEAADNLKKLNIQIGHMIHMPSYIYARIGRWHDASVANQNAVTADQAHLAAYEAEGLVPPEVRLALFSRELDNDDVLTGIQLPTLVIHGAEDQVVRLSSSEHITETISDAELLVYDDVSHALFFEDSQRFDHDLVEFVRGTR